MAAARTEVIEQLRSNLICHICMERRELRLLPCQNTMCLACLERIVANAVSKAETPRCPYCRNELTLSPSNYPLCRLAADFEREFDRLEAAIKECSLHDEVTCETNGCLRHIDWYCEGCQEFICTRCSKRNTCTGPDPDHQLVDYEKLKEESFRKFEEWREIKKTEIDLLATTRTGIASEMRQEIAGASNDTVADIQLKHERMKTSHKILSLKTLEEGEKAVLDYYTDGINQVSDTEYIRLVQQMTVALKSNNKTTVESCRVVMYELCYSVTKTSEGQLAVGRNRGFDILDSEGRLIRAVEVRNNNVISMQEYNGNMFTLCKEPPPGSKRHVIVFNNSTYKEVRRWQVPDYKNISQLTVSNNKVYVSDPENRRLCVYPVDYYYSMLPFFYQPPTYMIHPSFNTPNYLVTCAVNSIAISDSIANKVHWRCLNDDSVTWTSSAVSKPRGICCGVKRDMWVWSAGGKFLIRLFSHSGDIKEEITHHILAKFPAKDDIHDMCIRSDGRVLWAAAGEQGLLKLNITYE